MTGTGSTDPQAISNNTSQNSISSMGVNSCRIAGNVTASAAGRLNVIQARIDELRRKAVLDPAAAEEYQALLEERGQLDLVVADSLGGVGVPLSGKVTRACLDVVPKSPKMATEATIVLSLIGVSQGTTVRSWSYWAVPTTVG